MSATKTPLKVTVTVEFANFLLRTQVDGRCRWDASPAEIRRLPGFRQAGGRSLKDHDIGFTLGLVQGMLRERIEKARRPAA